MWIKKKILLDKKSVECEVNCSNGFIEIETSFDKKLLNTQEITIDGKTYSVTECNNIGERDETLRISVEEDKNNEHKSIQVRKNN